MLAISKANAVAQLLQSLYPNAATLPRWTNGLQMYMYSAAFSSNASRSVTLTSNGFQSLCCTFGAPSTRRITFPVRRNVNVASSVWKPFSAACRCCCACCRDNATALRLCLSRAGIGGLRMIFSFCRKTRMNRPTHLKDNSH